MKYLPAFILVLLISTPFSAFASTPKPSCDLTITTPRGEVSVSRKTSVLVTEGENVKLSWTSNNATRAKDDDNEAVALSGSESFSVIDDTSYSYTFSSGSKKAVCEADLTVASGSFDVDTISNADARPTISGTAEGTRMVRVMISDSDGNSVFTSKNIRVRGGEWSVKLTKALSKGAYDITLYGDKKYKLNELSSGTLGIGVAGSAGPSNTNGTSAATLSASTLPLLTGGSAGPSASIPVEYLRLTNSSAAPATLAGVWLKQNGTAPASSVIGFTTVDDKALLRTQLGGVEGVTPFKNGMAYIPLNVSFSPGQLRIITIKAQLGRNLSAAAGTTLSLDVASLDTSAKVNAFFPIRGTTWTLRAY